MIEPLLVDFYPDFYTEPKSQPKEIKACDNLEFQKCRRFGLGYMGSKNKIVKALIPQLPSAKYFVDLFAGGCAMTHGAILSGKYERFIANDISDAPSLFQRAINGEFRDEKRWISRDDFKMLKDKEPYVKYVWSFGNNVKKGYLYGKDIEPYKKALWEFAVNKNAEPLREYGFNVDNLLSLNSSEKRRLAFALQVKKTTNSSYNPFLQSLKCLENLQRLENLQISQKSYNEVELHKHSACVIYYDPPYINSEGYYKQSLKNGKTSFNHGEFYDYVESLARRGYKVFISEYEMPKDRFKSVFSVVKRQQLHHLGSGAIKQEHLFVPIV